MAGYEVSVGRELLPGLLSGQDGLAKLVEEVRTPILEAQVTEALGAQRHKRTEERAGYRNGTRFRTLYTAGGAGDALGAADAGRQFLDGHFQALPEKRAGIRAGVDGEGGARRFDAEDDGDRPRPSIFG